MAQILTEFVRVAFSQREAQRRPLEGYTREEVLRHCTRDDCWLIIDNQVYDASPYLSKHTGGQDLILEHAGRDATSAFRGKGHSPAAWNVLETFKIGTLRSGARVNS